MPLPLTVAIPTMDRWEKFLSKTLPTYLAVPQVAEVLICDENGHDIEAILKSEWATHPKLTLHQNSKRLGIYHNKRQCIELAKNKWVAVLDSDNIFNEEYFYEVEEIFKKEGPKPNHFIACADAIFINEETGEVSKPIEQFGGYEISKENWNQIFGKPRWNFLLNDGNWIVPKSVLQYLPTDVEDKDILAADAIYMVHKFVKAGYIFDVREELKYFHIVHDKSTWKATATESNRIFVGTNWFL